MKFIIQITKGFLLISVFVVSSCYTKKEKAKAGEQKPLGPIACFGSTPKIDGVFEDGEWADATIIKTDSDQQFRIKHDGNNLYFAFDQDGGNLWINKDSNLHVLHSSAQLGFAEYILSDSLKLSLNKKSDYQFYGLQNHSITEIDKMLSNYLAENDWVTSTGYLGNLAQAEWAVSFDLLHVTNKGQRFVKTPGIYIFTARMRLSPEEKEILLALPLEDRKNQYPPLVWSGKQVHNDSLNRGYYPKTIRIDTRKWSNIWIDFKRKDI